MYHVPSDVVTLVNTNPAAALVTVILAPGTTAPVLSVTAPTMVAVPVGEWAKRLHAMRAEVATRRRNIKDSFWSAMLSRVRRVVNEALKTDSQATAPRA